MKGNPWLVGYVVFTVLLMGGAGYYFVQGRAAYNEKFNGWDDLKSKIAKLEKETPHPSPENAETLDSLVKDYEKQVTSLYTSLSRYQRDLNTQLSDTEFTNRVLKEKMTAFTALAAEKKLEIEKKEEFFMGFDAYRSTFARTDLVPLLNFQLESVDHVLKHLAESGVELLKSVTRENLPGEAAPPVTPAGGNAASAPAAPAAVVQKFPMQVRFVSDHRAFVEFVNRIANDKEFFFVLRALRVDNSQPDGPVIGAAADPNTAIWKDKDGKVIPKDEMEKIGLGTLSPADFKKAMEDLGHVEVRQDARIIFGKEKLEVVAVIDVVRFLPPDQAPAPAAGATATDTKGKGKSTGK